MKTVTVTQPDLPPLDEFVPLLQRIWDSRWLTNAGPFHQEFESALARHLGIEHVALFTNATIGLVTALQALRVSGEVVTTPYSFVATANALRWNNIEPVFADIEPGSFGLDPVKVEAAITPRTAAILPVHVYGRPCAVDALGEIAARRRLKVIYDAAHAFGVSLRGRSILTYGDLSVLSFHATKVFTTGEGGAMACPDAETKRQVDFLKNFGFADEVTVVAPGINGKMGEIQAALGLLQLRHVAAALDRRRRVDAAYREGLRGVAGIVIPDLPAECTHNYAYFPILVGPEYRLSRDALYSHLRGHGIHPRRYFYPLISEFPMYRHLPSAAPERLPVATEVSRRILCLPIYPALQEPDLRRIIGLIRGD